MIGINWKFENKIYSKLFDQIPTVNTCKCLLTFFKPTLQPDSLRKKGNYDWSCAPGKMVYVQNLSPLLTHMIVTHYLVSKPYNNKPQGGGRAWRS